MPPKPTRPNPYAAMMPQQKGVDGRPDRNMPAPPAPATSQGQSERQTDAYTLITQVGQPIPGQLNVLYNGDRLWVRVRLVLETAGPVAVGTRADLLPMLSGKGQLLETDKEREFTISKGTKLYYIAGSVNRIAVTIEPFAWIEAITGNVEAVLNEIRRGGR